jgi:dTDP-4-amino-4,6-dideoxygalactose transaminase
MKLPIPYGKQEITPEDEKRVLKALHSDYLTQGPEISAFEEAFKQYINTPYAVAVSNGTAALHLGAKILGTSKSTRAVTSPLTFAASANCILYNDGQVDFCDIDLATGLMDEELLAEKLKENQQIDGIIPVSYAGYPVNTEVFRQVVGAGKWILEDACHAPGAWYTDSLGNKVMSGSNMYTDASIFSFHPVKHIAAGEGGMLTLADESKAVRAAMLRTHGITKDPSQLEQNHGGWYYELQELGLNYRLTDLQAALANSQLQRAEDNINKRLKIADIYDLELANLPIHLPQRPEKGRHAFHLYVIRTEKRKELYDYLKSKQILAQVHYIPVHLHPVYKKLGFRKGQFPNAEKYYEECLSIPMFPSLKENQQAYVIENIKAFFS